MIESILAFLGKIFAEVLKDVLKTPAQVVEVKEADGIIELPSTTVDELLSEYRL